jgi:phage-related protein (TIGR01555 family)
MVMRADMHTALNELGAAARGLWSTAVSWLSNRKRDDLLTVSGLAHRIVWSVPEDALAEGWTTAGDDAEDLDDLDDALRLEDRMLTAAGAARADGGAYLWVIVRGEEDFTQPLGEGPHDIAAVHVVECDELVVESYVVDLESPDYTHPEYAYVTMTRDGLTTPTERVHGSRLIYVPGMRSLPSQRTRRTDCDLSALQVYYPAIRDMEESWASGAVLVKRLSMPQLKVVDTSRAASDEAGWLSRLRLFARSMSTKGLMVIMGTDELTWNGPSVAGYSELLRSLAERLSAVEGIPITRLLGQAPAGMTSDDASGARTYYDLIERYRRTVLRPAILQVYRIARGDSKRAIVWPSLEKPSRLQRAAMSLQLAQRDAVLVQLGAIADAESRARFTDDGEVDDPVLDEVYDVEPLDLDETAPMPMPPAPDDEPVEDAAA